MKSRRFGSSRLRRWCRTPKSPLDTPAQIRSDYALKADGRMRGKKRPQRLAVSAAPNPRLAGPPSFRGGSIECVWPFFNRTFRKTWARPFVSGPAWASRSTSSSPAPSPSRTGRSGARPSTMAPCARPNVMIPGPPSPPRPNERPAGWCCSPPAPPSPSPALTSLKAIRCCSARKKCASVPEHGACDAAAGWALIILVYITASAPFAERRDGGGDRLGRGAAADQRVSLATATGLGARRDKRS